MHLPRVVGGAKIAKIATQWMSTLSRVSFEDITSMLRAFGILYWESSSLLRERMAIIMIDIRHLDRLVQLLTPQ